MAPGLHAGVRSTDAKTWLRGLAHHEAGHGVIGALVGERVDEISLPLEGDHLMRSGYIAVWPRPDSTPTGALTARIAALLAGEAAFARYTGHRALARASARIDDRDIAAAIASSTLPEEVKGEVSKQARGLATAGLSLYWPCVTKIASLLLFAPRRRIDGASVHNIVARLQGPFGDFHRLVGRLVA